MDKSTGRLVDFSLAFSSQPLPDSTIHECKRRIVDTLGCAFGGYDDAMSRMARKLAASQAGTPGATVWGTSAATSQEAAAFANGVMSRVLDMSDTYLGRSGGHPCDAIAGIMAVGEAAGASGMDLIKAVSLAYEIYCSFSDSVDLNTGGWDHPVYGGVACALGIGSLLGFTREQLANAVSLSITPNMALYQTRQGEPSSWRSCAAANATRNAIFAAQLAREGCVGPAEVFEGRSGLWRAAGEFDWKFSPAGAPHKITRTHMKRFPVCYFGQSAAWAAVQASTQVDKNEITEIEVATFRKAVAAMGSEPSRWAPDTREAADHSLPFVVATGLLHGEINSRSYDHECLADDGIATLMGKTRVVEDAALSAQFPETSACRLVIRTASKEPLVMEVEHAKGHADFPMDDAEVNAKFVELFQEYGDAQHAEAILATLWKLEQMPDMRQLAAVLAGPVGAGSKR